MACRANHADYVKESLMKTTTIVWKKAVARSPFQPAIVNGLLLFRKMVMSRVMRKKHRKAIRMRPIKNTSVYSAWYHTINRLLQR